MTRFLFVSTPMGPLGSGAGGGVELMLTNLAQELVRQGDQVHILAPAGSMVEGVPCTTAPGLSPLYAQASARTGPIEISLPSVLANLWEQAFAIQQDFDVIINWAYDWLPFYLTRFFQTPVAHIVSMGSLTDALDLTLEQTLQAFPGRVAVHSLAQATTFKFAQSAIATGENPFFVLPCGIDLSCYTFVPEADGPLCWVGRISPEKGLEDCAAIAQRLQMPVNVLGRLQDVDYWQWVRRQYPEAPLKYLGFFPTEQMQAIMGQSRAMLMTQKWTEAFGVVVVEALACGVPVITYRRGGPAEIVEDGLTGWIVEPDDVDEMVAALDRIDKVDRHTCRQQAETRYSLQAMATQFKLWTEQVRSL
ncbi:MAG: glycosyltransferase family 4 protein [Synechococcaceae cyanobacterium SM2_3_1]|nr:glycosyltransferase family 4 protein [Synechococcaceae cyanobacterium SM2_3_1]